MATEQSCDSVYAELLSNIRQVSLAISLCSPSDSSTRVFLAADGCSLQLTHHGKLTALQLPGKVAMGNTTLPVHRRGSAGLSWRLPLAQPTSLERGDASATHGAAAGMWSAFDLAPGSEVRCRQCSTVLVKKDRIKAWKDLPSENWAEMMEFWHCHKPGSHNHQNNGGRSAYARGDVGVLSNGVGAPADEKSLASRGYGANSRVTAQPGVGFIDLITLLFEPSDCDGIIYSRFSFDQGTTDLQGLLTTESPTDFDIRRPHAYCSSCRAQLGFFDPRTDAVTLWKYQVLCQSTSSDPPPGISACISVTLTAILDRSGSAKSMLMPMPKEGVHPGSAAARAEAMLAAQVEDVLSIWILNPSIVYCSTAQKETSGVPAIRLLYKLVNREEAETMLEAVVCETQEINAPSETIQLVLKRLDESNLLLRPTDRIFQGWKVGLLRR